MNLSKHKVIDKDNFVYLNAKPRLKFGLYAFVLGGLFLICTLAYSIFATMKFSDIGGDPDVKGVHMSFRAPQDAYFRFVESYSFINKVDPFDAINNKSIEKYKFSGGGISPNGLLMHAILCPAFLPPFFAIWIYIIFLAICLAISAFLIYKYTTQRTGVFVALLCAMLFLFNKYTLVGFFISNYAIFVFAVIIGLMFTNFFEKHPIIGGIIMGLAMVKVQMMLLMFIPFLVQKRFLSIGVSVFVVLASIVFVGIYVDKSPFVLIQEYLAYGGSAKMYMSKASTPYMGLLVDLFDCSLETKMILGKINTFLLFMFSLLIVYLYRKENKIFLYGFLLVVSTLWGYNYSATTLPIVYISLAIPIIISLAKMEHINFVKLSIYGMFLGIMSLYIPYNERGDVFVFQSTLTRLYILFVLFYLIYDYKKNDLIKYIE